MEQSQSEQSLMTGWASGPRASGAAWRSVTTSLRERSPMGTFSTSTVRMRRSHKKSSGCRGCLSPVECRAGAPRRKQRGPGDSGCPGGESPGKGAGRSQGSGVRSGLGSPVCCGPWSWQRPILPEGPLWLLVAPDSSSATGRRVLRGLSAKPGRPLCSLPCHTPAAGTVLSKCALHRHSVATPGSSFYPNVW